jgi:hypothetical protein
VHHRIVGGVAWVRRHPVIASTHLVVAALVLFVATWRLGVADAAPDEFTYRHCAAEYLTGVFNCNREHPPLVKELLAIGIAVGNNSILDARLMTALIACATALFIYLFVSDVTDRIGGLIAAAAWGLLPQAGIEGNRVLEAVRIDRFAIIDPYVACFFAASLFAGWRWIHRRGRLWAFLTGCSCAAVTLAKAPGAAIAVTVMVFIFAVRRRELRLYWSELLFAVTAAVIVLVGVYAPLGAHGALSQISYMLHFKFNRIVLVDGHLYQRTPWWADISFATVGLSRPIAIVLAATSCVGLARYRLAASFALLSALALLLFVAIGVHLSSPNYWIEWEPGVIATSSIGIRSLFKSPLPVHRGFCYPALILSGAILLSGVVSTIYRVVNISPGPYQIAAASIHCQSTCLVEYAGYNNIPISYTTAKTDLVLGPPQGRSRVRHHPTYVVIDPALLVIHPSWRVAVNHFTTNAKNFGYVRVHSNGPIEIWRRVRA